MLKPPPRNESGLVEPHDHPQIGNEDGVIRRIPELWVVPGSSGGRRLSSMAFKPSSGENAGMSVDLEALIVRDQVDPRAYVTTPRWVGSIVFTAGKLRDEGFMVGYDPIEAEPPDQIANPYHGEVWGNFSKGKQRQLSKMAAWYVALPGVSLTAD